MPVHDWSRVSAGTFHDFHTAWIVAIRNALNGGLLPEGYYVQADLGNRGHLSSRAGPLTLTDSPPRVALIDELEESQLYAQRQNHLVIRHANGDSLIAIMEIVSSGNKCSRSALNRFVEKATSVLYSGIHLLVVDVQPPGTFDPQGIHGAVWSELKADGYVTPLGKPLTLVAYSAVPRIRAYVEPVAVGDVLSDMPLFLDHDHYISVPLERTYAEAFEGVPQRWRQVVEGK